MEASVMKIAMTDTWLRKLSLPIRGRVIYSDTRQQGLILRVSPKRKVWTVQYRIKGVGKIGKMSIGEYPNMSLKEARERAREIVGIARQGLDPRYEREKAIQQELESPTVQDFVDVYMDLWAKKYKRPVSVREDERQFRAYILPFIGHLKLKDINRRHLIALLDTVAARGEVQANRVRALLSKFFNFAVDRALIDSSPAVRLPRYCKEEPRVRKISDEEIKLFWEGTQAFLTPIMRDAARLALLTGQRRGTIVKAKWEEIENGVWSIPSEHMKNKINHILPLPDLALEILNARQKVNEYIFPGKDGKGHIASDSLTRALARARDKIGLNDIILHDMRSVVKSRLEQLGCPLADRIIGWKPQGVSEKHYNAYDYLPQKKIWITRWNNELRRILGLDEEHVKVIQFPQRGGV